MIKVQNLTKYFDENKALDNISFDIKSQEIVGFVGENGAGKSTTMRILSTLILDYEGEVFINNKKLEENIVDSRKIIGFMPDQYGLYDDMTLGEYLEFVLISYGLKNEKDIIKNTLKSVFLADKIDSKIAGLSRGMTQRICLAKAIITNPKILILDEPASGLDPKLRAELKNLLLDLKTQGVTIFVSSHILAELGDYCDRIIFISNGKIVKDGNIEKLKKENKNNIIFIHTNNNDKSEKLLKDYKIKHMGDKLELTLDKKTETNDILKILIKNDITVEQFYLNTSSLEDIYLEVTG